MNNLNMERKSLTSLDIKKIPVNKCIKYLDVKKTNITLP